MKTLLNTTDEQEAVEQWLTDHNWTNHWYDITEEFYNNIVGFLTQDEPQ